MSKVVQVSSSQHRLYGDDVFGHMLWCAECLSNCAEVYTIFVSALNMPGDALSASFGALSCCTMHNDSRCLQMLLPASETVQRLH